MEHRKSVFTILRSITPTSIQRRVVGSLRARGVSKYKQIIENAGWLMGERIVTMLLGMVVSVWLARYLGPDQFGIYNYALSFVGLFGFLSYLGLNAIVTRELVKTPGEKEEILGTTALLKFSGALLAFSMIVILLFLRPFDSITRLMIGVVAFGLFLDSFNVLDLWFQSRVESKYTVLSRGSSMVLGSLLKMVLLFAKAPLVAFAFAVVAEQALVVLGLLIAAARQGHRPTQWSRNWSRAKSFMQQSWPLVISSAGALIYLKIDQVMLGDMVGADEVGIYAVAARLSEVWYFVPTAIATSIFPAIVKSKQLDESVYQVRVQQSFNVVVWLAFAVAIPVSITAPSIIDFLYGDAYKQASQVLIIHIWACPAVFMGMVLSKWLVVEDLLVFSFTRHGLGAVINVLVNLVLIPRYGATGAAFATLVSYTIASYLACFTDQRTLVAAKMMTRALFSPFIIVIERTKRVLQ